MEDLPFGRIAALVPDFAVKNLPFGQNTDDDDEPRRKSNSGRQLESRDSTDYAMLTDKV